MLLKCPLMGSEHPADARVVLTALAAIPWL
jgi:hypothetical protein